MFELHGWCAVLTSPYESEKADVLKAKEEIVAYLHEPHWDNGVTSFLRVEFMGGELFVHLGRCANHDSGYLDDVRKLLAFIGEVAPGSYGAVYYRDDENTDLDNRWGLLSLKRGTVKEEADQLFSPIVPSIEDP